MRAILRWISPPGGDKRSHWHGIRIDRPTPTRDKSGDDLWHARTPSGRSFPGGFALGLTSVILGSNLHGWPTCLVWAVSGLRSAICSLGSCLGKPLVGGSVAVRAWLGDEASTRSSRWSSGAVAVRAWLGDEAGLRSHRCTLPRASQFVRGWEMKQRFSVSSVSFPVSQLVCGWEMKHSGFDTGQEQGK